MEEESSVKEYKSIQKIRTGESGFKALAGTCVALANAQGGIICIGIEDKTKRPAKNQKIEQKEVNEAVTKLRSLCFNVSLTNTEIKSDKEGNEYFCIGTNIPVDTGSFPKIFQNKKRENLVWFFRFHCL